MSKPKMSNMTPAAARRIASATSKDNGGKIPAKSFASRADAIVQRVGAAGPKGAQGVKR
jgi:hypothetical protein